MPESDHEQDGFHQAMINIEHALDIHSGIAPSENDALNRFRKLLTEHVAQLLTQDPERLKWLLYRIDVAEKQLAEVLANSDSDKVPAELARLMIDRQMEKAKTRELYRKDGEGDWS